MKVSVNRNGRLPLYHQIALNIQQRIAHGEWPVGSRIPTELNLATEYEASRVTVRQALSELEKDGIVIRKRPLGTFVNRLPDKLTPTVSVMVDFMNSLKVLGHKTEITTMSVGTVTNDAPDLIRLMGLRSEETFVEYRRRLDVNDAPMAWIRTMLPGSRFPGLESRPIVNNSLQDTLGKNFGVRPHRAEHWIEASNATSEDADILQTHIDRQVLRIETLFFDTEDNPMAFMTSILLADQMRLQLRSSTGDPMFENP